MGKTNRFLSTSQRKRTNTKRKNQRTKTAIRELVMANNGQTPERTR